MLLPASKSSPDRRCIRENFPKAYEAIKSYTKPHPETGERRSLPKKLTSRCAEFAEETAHPLAESRVPCGWLRVSRARVGKERS
jgi:hypothetical protein